MAESEISKVEFPDEIEASIRQVMAETGLSKDEIVLQLMSYFLELINDTETKMSLPWSRKCERPDLRSRRTSV